MIDMEKAYQVFFEYVKAYDETNPKVKLKIDHTYSVVDKVKAIVCSLPISKEQQQLACLIALLHDIGRFEQLKRYNSFYDDKTIDHASLGVQILFDEQWITRFIDTREYDTIIHKAIFNHNKFEIEETLNQEELLHAKIIRDGDKIDNLEIKCTVSLETLYNQTKEEIEIQTISEEVYASFINHTSILSTLRKTSLDMWVSHVAFVFDLYFPYSFKEVLENQYIDKLLDRLDYKHPDTIQKIERIRQVVTNYALDKSKGQNT